LDLSFDVLDYYIFILLFKLDYLVVKLMKEQLKMYFSDEPSGEEYGKEGDEEN